jgi:hypothetical protein
MRLLCRVDWSFSTTPTVLRADDEHRAGAAARDPEPALIVELEAEESRKRRIAGREHAAGGDRARLARGEVHADEGAVLRARRVEGRAVLLDGDSLGIREAFGREWCAMSAAFAAQATSAVANPAAILVVIGSPPFERAIGTLIS